MYMYSDDIHIYIYSDDDSASQLPQVVRLLLRFGGERLLLAATASGYTCLHAAAAAGRPKVIRTLLRAGGRTLLEAGPAHGGPGRAPLTPLAAAAAAGRLETVRLLAAEMGPDVLGGAEAAAAAAAAALGGHGETEALLRRLSSPAWRGASPLCASGYRRVLASGAAPPGQLSTPVSSGGGGRSHSPVAAPRWS
jgi:hypothetical protein